LSSRTTIHVEMVSIYYFITIFIWYTCQICCQAVTWSYKCNIDIACESCWNMYVHKRWWRCACRCKKNICFSPVYNVDVGEALDLFYAFHWVHDLHLKNFDFVLDSKILLYASTMVGMTLRNLAMSSRNVSVVLFLISKTLVLSLGVDKPM